MKVAVALNASLALDSALVVRALAGTAWGETAAKEVLLSAEAKAVIRLCPTRRM